MKSARGNAGDFRPALERHAFAPVKDRREHEPRSRPTKFGGATSGDPGDENALEECHYANGRKEIRS